MEDRWFRINAFQHRGSAAPAALGGLAPVAHQTARLASRKAKQFALLVCSTHYASLKALFALRRKDQVALSSVVASMHIMRNLKSGSTLLYALLVLAALSAASLALSGSVISSLKQAQSIDSAVKAYYAANAGAEEGLYNFRKLGNTVASLNGSATLPNKSSWVRTAQGNEDSITASLKANESLELDIYDPENSLTAPGSPIKSVRLTWTASGGEWVEVSYISWRTDGSVDSLAAKRLFGSSAQPAIISLADASSYLYKIRIKALYSDIKDLVIKAYGTIDASGVEIPIPGRLRMKITGSAAETYQAVEVTMPQKNPASPLYDYVIFSEDPLIK